MSKGGKKGLDQCWLGLGFELGFGARSGYSAGGVAGRNLSTWPQA